MDGIHHTPLAPLKIAVLAGGQSAERKISLQSGEAVATSLRQRGHTVTMVDPAVQPLEGFDWSRVDLAFLALHGTYGEDGVAQKVLEKLGVVFTGSSSEASRLAFSKSAAKERFIQHGVPTPSYMLIHESDPYERVAEHARRIGYPIVVKPNAQGSSIGVTIVRTEAELEAALSQCFYFESFGLLEKMIEGGEFTLGVIDFEPLPLIRIETNRGFFDYQAKYEDDATQYLFDYGVDQATLDLLTETGIAACRALGTRGVARTDICISETGKPFVLEVNTIPGMTDHSLVPKAAARIGLDMGQLCETIIERTLQAAGRRAIRRAS